MKQWPYCFSVLVKMGLRIMRRTFPQWTGGVWSTHSNFCNFFDKNQSFQNGRWRSYWVQFLTKMARMFLNHANNIPIMILSHLKNIFQLLGIGQKIYFFKMAATGPIFLGMSPKRIGVVLRVKTIPWLSFAIFNERFFKLERSQTKLTRWVVVTILDFLPKFFFRQIMSLG